MKQPYIFPADTCVICGSTIPEGRQICPVCECSARSSDRTFIRQPAIPAPGPLCRLKLLFKK